MAAAARGYADAIENTKTEIQDLHNQSQDLEEKLREAQRQVDMASSAAAMSSAVNDPDAMGSNTVHDAGGMDSSAATEPQMINLSVVNEPEPMNSSAVNEPEADSSTAKEPEAIDSNAVNDLEALQERAVKIVLVGDPGVGKSSLHATIAEGAFPLDCSVPKRRNPHVDKIATERFGDVIFELCDIKSSDDDDRARMLGYCRSEIDTKEHPDIFMICYAVDSKSSLASTDKWVEEIRSLQANLAALGMRATIPYMLVGLKRDLPRKESKVNTTAAKRRATKTTAIIGRNESVTVMECSAKTSKNVKEVLLTAIQLAIEAADVVMSPSPASSNDSPRSLPPRDYNEDPPDDSVQSSPPSPPLESEADKPCCVIL